jgi:hypothetical protein
MTDPAGPPEAAHDLAHDLWDRPPRAEVECDRCGDFAEPYHVQVGFSVRNPDDVRIEKEVSDGVAD